MTVKEQARWEGKIHCLYEVKQMPSMTREMSWLCADECQKV
jgi:hypothetical protein